MMTISVSKPVWQAIANLGKFGETEDDVLRRVFNLPSSSNAFEERVATDVAHPVHRAQASGPRRSFATNRMSSYISDNELRISFASGPLSSWALPAKSDKNSLRTMRQKATAFAEKHGATLGQVNAVRKTLTDAGYHLTK